MKVPYPITCSPATSWTRAGWLVRVPPAGDRGSTCVGCGQGRQKRGQEAPGDKALLQRAVFCNMSMSLSAGLSPGIG